MTYEQEWAQYQDLLNNVQRINSELLAAENARSADQLSVQQDGKQTDTRHLDPNIENLRAEKIAAETKVSLAELNLQHSQGLSEQLPPVQDEQLPPDEHLPPEEHLHLIQEEQLPPAQEEQLPPAQEEQPPSIKEEQLPLAQNRGDNADQKVIDDWRKDINIKELSLKVEMERHNDRMTFLENRLNETKMDGYEEKLEKLKENDIKAQKDFYEKIKEIDKEKRAFRSAVETTRNLEPENRAKEVERQRKEFDRQKIIEREIEIQQRDARSR